LLPLCIRLVWLKPPLGWPFPYAVGEFDLPRPPKLPGLLCQAGLRSDGRRNASTAVPADEWGVFWPMAIFTQGATRGEPLYPLPDDLPDPEMPERFESGLPT